MYYYSIIYWRDFRTAWQTGQPLWYTNCWITCYNNVSLLFTSTSLGLFQFEIKSKNIFQCSVRKVYQGDSKVMQITINIHQGVCSLWLLWSARKELFFYHRGVGRSARLGGGGSRQVACCQKPHRICGRPNLKRVPICAHYAYHASVSYMASKCAPPWCTHCISTMTSCTNMGVENVTKPWQTKTERQIQSNTCEPAMH